MRTMRIDKRAASCACCARLLRSTCVSVGVFKVVPSLVKYTHHAAAVATAAVGAETAVRNVHML